MLATSLRPCSGGGGYEGPVRRDASGAGPPVRPRRRGARSGRPRRNRRSAGEGRDDGSARRRRRPVRGGVARGSGALSRIGELLEREIGLVRLARRIDPDVVVSQVDPAAVHAARLVGARAVVFDDSEHERLVAGLTHRFADVVCTPSGFDRDVPNQRRYDGFHELAYLHPNRFTPDPAALQRHGVDPESSYAVVRFVAWDAHHDLGRRGFSPAGKQQLVERLDEHGTVCTSRPRANPDGGGRILAPGRGDTRPVGVRGLLRGRLADDGDRGRGARNARGADERVRWRRRHEQLPGVGDGVRAVTVVRRRGRRNRPRRRVPQGTAT